MIDDSGLGQTPSGQTVPAVLESREHLEAILQGVTDGVVVEDVDGDIVYANAAAANLFDLPSPLSLLSGTVAEAFAPFDIFDPTGAQLTLDDLPSRDIFAGEPSARRTIVRRERTTREERWWIVHASPIRDDSGVRFAISIVRDVTERIQGTRENARLAAIVASSADAIIGKNLDAVITNWNPAAERLYGYTAEEAIGQPLTLLFPRERAGELASIVERVRAGEESSFESIHARKDGSLVDVALTISPILDQDGRIAGSATISRDITAYRRALESVRLLAEASEVLGASLDYQATLASVAELVVPRLADWCSINMVDETGAPSLLALAHADPAKLTWLRILQEPAPGEDEAARALIQALGSGEPLVYRDLPEEVLLANARTPQQLEAFRQIGFRSGVVVPMMARGGVIGTISLVYAESGRVYEDDEIALAREIARRAALAVDNAWLFAEAQQAAQAREDFLLTASHELRTPLTSVKAAAQLVARYMEQPEPDRRRVTAMIASLQGEIGRLETLSLDLLDAARIQRGRVDLEPETCDLVAIAGDVLHEMERSNFLLPSHRLTLDAGGPVTGVWDARRLRQAVSNLVSNALKYSPDGGEVCVRVAYDGDQAVLVVEDEGMGIDPAEAERLFEPFERGAAVRRSTGGVGLGLYITRQVIETHGGTIAIDSRPGRGSRFTVRLPREVRPEA